MRDFDTKRRGLSRMRHHPVLVAALALVLLGTVGFAAAGGVALVRSWLVTTMFNGEVIDSREVVPDENGKATFTIPLPHAEGQARVDMAFELDGGEDGDGDGVKKTINVALEGNDDGTATVEIGQEQDEDEKDDE